MNAGMPGNTLLSFEVPNHSRARGAGSMKTPGLRQLCLACFPWALLAIVAISLALVAWEELADFAKPLGLRRAGDRASPDRRWGRAEPIRLVLPLCAR